MQMFLNIAAKKREKRSFIFLRKGNHLYNKKKHPPFIRIIYSKYLLLQLYIIIISHRHVSSSLVLSYSHLSPSSFLTLRKEVLVLEGNT